MNKTRRNRTATLTTATTPRLCRVNSFLNLLLKVGALLQLQAFRHPPFRVLADTHTAHKEGLP